MEYKMKCNVCGKVYCYTDEDLKNNKHNAAMSAISAVGSLASVFGGTIFHTAHLSNQTDKYSDKVIDYSKCPYCNSRDIVSVSDEEFAKLAQSTNGGTVTEKRIEVNANATPESLLKRAHLFLEDGEWDHANAYADACLDVEPDNACGYVCKLMAELHVKELEALGNLPKPFDDSNSFKKAVRFADEELKEKLKGYIVKINERNKRDELEFKYEEASEIMSSAEIEAEFTTAAEIFAEIADYKDSAEMEKLCYLKADEEKKNAIYNDAKEKMGRGNITHMETACRLFETIADWKDSSEQVVLCRDKIKALSLENEAKAKKNKKIFIVSASVVCLCIVFFVLLNSVIIPGSKYNKAVSFMNKGDYDKAIEIFTTIDNHKDSAGKIKLCHEKKIEKQNEEASRLIKNGDYEKALILLRKQAGNKGSRELLKRFKVSYDKKIINNTSGTTFEFYTFDKNNNCIKERIKYANGNTYICSYSYDKKGNCIRKESGYEDADELTLCEYFYDDEGNCIKETYDAPGEKADRVTEYSYDESGNRIRAGHEDGWTKYSYDANGNCTEEIYSIGSKRQFKYDAYGNVTEDKFITSDGREETMIMSYNTCGDMIEKTDLYLSGNSSNTECSYDEYGNLISKKIKFKDSDSVNVVKYTYEGIRVTFK